MSKIKTVDGALIRSAGTSDTPPLVFLPAFGDTGHCYDAIFSSTLSKQFSLTSVDLLGFGASPERADVRPLPNFVRH